ncbi:MAG: U32 family peptidase, partial [Planctomycetota bacterium]
TEVFIHGALCYCYSGLCLYSSQLRGRSGNRGRCAYPCRDLFTVTQPAAALTPPPAAAGFAFSMKDLALPEQVEALRAAGVASLKDIDLIVNIAAGSTVEAWIAYAADRHKIPFVAGTTAVMAPDTYPWLNSGQMAGLAKRGVAVTSGR